VTLARAMGVTADFPDAKDGAITEVLT